MKKSLGAQTIIYPTPVLIVGTYDKDNKPNAMAVAWGGICCSKPPCVAVSLRSATYSHGNIMLKGAFTVNIPSEQYVKESDYFGMASGRSTDKFQATGLTPEKSELVEAPLIKEFPLTLECSVVQVVEIGLHTQFIGEILDVKADENVLDAQGNLDLAKIQPFFYAPQTRRYYGTGKDVGQAFKIGSQIGS